MPIDIPSLMNNAVVKRPKGPSDYAHTSIDLVSITVPEPVYVGLAVGRNTQEILALHLSGEPLDEVSTAMGMRNRSRVGLQSGSSKALRLNHVGLTQKVRDLDRRREQIKAQIASLQDELENL